MIKIQKSLDPFACGRKPVVSLEVPFDAQELSTLEEMAAADKLSLDGLIRHLLRCWKEEWVASRATWTLDLEKLEDLRRNKGGKFKAACPACITKGCMPPSDDLHIDDGEQGRDWYCVLDVEDYAHQQLVYELAGRFCCDSLKAPNPPETHVSDNLALDILEDDDSIRALEADLAAPETCQINAAQPPLAVQEHQPQASSSAPRRFVVIAADIAVLDRSKDEVGRRVQFVLCEDSLEAMEVVRRYPNGGICPVMAYSKEDLLRLIEEMEAVPLGQLEEDLENFRAGYSEGRDASISERQPRDYVVPPEEQQQQSQQPEDAFISSRSHEGMDDLLDGSNLDCERHSLPHAQRREASGGLPPNELGERIRARLGRIRTPKTTNPQQQSEEGESRLAGIEG